MRETYLQLPQDYFKKKYMDGRENVFVFDRVLHLERRTRPKLAEDEVIICRTNKDIHHVCGRTVSRADTGYIHKA